MTRHLSLAWICVGAFVLASAAPLAAQQHSGPWKPVGFLDVDAGVQASTSAFASAVTFPAYGESGTMSASYKFVPAPVFSLRAGFRVGGAVALGLALARYTKDGEAAITA